MIKLRKIAKAAVETWPFTFLHHEQPANRVSRACTNSSGLVFPSWILFLTVFYFSFVCSLARLSMAQNCWEYRPSNSSLFFSIPLYLSIYVSVTRIHLAFSQLYNQWQQKNILKIKFINIFVKLCFSSYKYASFRKLLAYIKTYVSILCIQSFEWR